MGRESRCVSKVTLTWEVCSLAMMLCRITSAWLSHCSCGLLIIIRYVHLLIAASFFFTANENQKVHSAVLMLLSQSDNFTWFLLHIDFFSSSCNADL